MDAQLIKKKHPARDQSAADFSQIGAPEESQAEGEH